MLNYFHHLVYIVMVISLTLYVNKWKEQKKKIVVSFIIIFIQMYVVLFLKIITYVKLQILKAEEKNDIAHKWLDTSLQLQNLWMAFFFRRSSLPTF